MCDEASTPEGRDEESSLPDIVRSSVEIARRMRLGLAVHALAEGSEATMSALLSAKSARWGDKGPQRALDLAALDATDIEAALRSAGVTPPQGSSLSDYAGHIGDQIARVFPTEVLLNRATALTDSLVRALRRVFDGEGDTPRVLRDPQVNAFVHLNPGLGLAEIINNARDAAAVLATVKERVGWVEQVRALNPGIDLLSIDFLPGSEDLEAVKFDGLTTEAQALVVANLKAQQRILCMAGGVAGPNNESFNLEPILKEPKCQQ